MHRDTAYLAFQLISRLATLSPSGLDLLDDLLSTDLIQVEWGVGVEHLAINTNLYCCSEQLFKVKDVFTNSTLKGLESQPGILERVNSDSILQ